MKRRLTKPCAQCIQLQKQIEELRETVRQLQEALAKARKDSSTSNKPPSSDIVKPSKPAPHPEQPQRSIGGQPGHPPHFRTPFAPEQLTNTYRHALTNCPDCGGVLEATEELPRLVQQVDLNPVTFTIEEHHSCTSWCPHCQKRYTAPLPKRIAEGGLLGPQLTALVAYLKGVCHASFSTIRRFFRDVLQLSISRGYLVKVIGKVTRALEQPYQELLRLLPDENILNVDETGHKLKGAQWWTWCFRAELFVLFHIDAHRSADVLMEVLGKEFAGVLGSDCLGAYRRYMRECNVVIQFCLAHLIRDVKFLTKLPAPAEQAYGERLREGLRQLFQVIHEREKYSPPAYQALLEAKRQQILQDGTENVPAGKHSAAMAQRLKKHGAAYFTFITTPGIEPTNNLAEQAIRFVVIDRHITQGTRSEGGNRWSERIWTVMATCALTGQSVATFLYECVCACWDGRPLPKLLPSLAPTGG